MKKKLQIEKKEKDDKEKQKGRVAKKATYIAQLKNNPSLITSLETWARDDKDIVECVLIQDGLLLQYAGENLKNDKGIAKIALDKDIMAFSYISDFLKTDECFILDCLSKF